MEREEVLILGMVGLPARGKSYISRKLARLLNWTGLKVKVFNIGMYRRSIVGADCNSNFFDQTNKEALKAREECALLAMNDMINYLEGNFIYIIKLTIKNISFSKFRLKNIQSISKFIFFSTEFPYFFRTKIFCLKIK